MIRLDQSIHSTSTNGAGTPATYSPTPCSYRRVRRNTCPPNSFAIVTNCRTLIGGRAPVGLGLRVKCAEAGVSLIACETLSDDRNTYAVPSNTPDPSALPIAIVGTYRYAPARDAPARSIPARACAYAGCDPLIAMSDHTRNSVAIQNASPAASRLKRGGDWTPAALSTKQTNPNTSSNNRIVIIVNPSHAADNLRRACRSRDW